MSEEVTLKVAEARQKDVGTRRARVSDAVMKELGISSGDVLQVEGDSSAGVIAWRGHPGDRNDLIRIDGTIRDSAGVHLGDRVKVKKIETETADRIVLSPVGQLSLSSEYLEQFLKSNHALEGLPISKGQGLRVRRPLGGEQVLRVTSTDPSGTVVPDRSTEIRISETAEPGEGGEAGPTVTYEDIGGLDDELQKVREMIELPMKNPELFQKLGIEPPKGVILHGPPGTGKTLIAKAVANEADAYFESIRGPEIMSKYYGESEKKLREIFEEAQENTPAVIFIDEIDSIAPKRSEAGGDVERRVVSQLLTLMDGLEARGDVVVIAATNQVNDIDPALRRPGRFDREIEVGVPDRDERKEILEIHTRGMPLGEDVSLDDLSDQTHGFVGADLESLTKESAMNALRDIIGEVEIEEEIPQEVLEELEVNRENFSEALKGVEPSAMREVFVEVPDVTWNDVGGQGRAKQELREAVEWPLLYADAFDAVAAEPPKGVLLHGPPGTGKTLLAKAVANESDANFISVKGPELLSKWVGESEKAVRETFRKARQSAPTVIFFDEIDALVPTRGSSTGESQATERVISQMLTELDGMESLEQVVVIAATNRPDLIDPALLRQGRLERHVAVEAPDEEAREAILRIHTKGMPLADDVDLADIAADTEGYVGADLEGVAKRASIFALRDRIKHGMKPQEVSEMIGEIEVGSEHFERAIDEVESARSRGELESHLEASKKMDKTGGDMEVR